jgi:hypothetical protein
LSAQASQTKCLVVGAGGSFGTLQEAVDATSPGATLKVKGTCHGPTTISKDLSIVGQSNNGFGPATLEGARTGQRSRPVITVNGDVTVTISGLSITHGPGFGGIYNREGSLTLNDSTVTNNFSAYGGGIYNGGSLRITNSTVSNNGAEGEGGGILNEKSGSLTLTNSTVSGDGAEDGSGIDNRGGSLTLISSTVSGNFAVAERGGGIENADGSVTITDSTVSGNTVCGCGAGHVARGAGGGIDNGGLLTVTNSTVSGNKARWRGGGIYNGASLTLSNSSVGDNTAGYGGGVFNEGPLTLTNSTVTGNTTTEGLADNGPFGGGGGGIYNASSLTLNGSSSVIENTAKDGAGIFTEKGGVNLNASSSVTHNSGEYGGGIFNETGTVHFAGAASVTLNRASVHGGGIYNNEGGEATVAYGMGWDGTLSSNQPDDIYNAPAVTTAISPTAQGETRSLILLPPGQYARITFSGKENERVSLVITEASVYGNVTILSPEGTKLQLQPPPYESSEHRFSAGGPELIVVTLPVTGTYTILVTAGDLKSGLSVKLSAYAVSDIIGSITPTAQGTEQSVSITTPGQRALFTVETPSEGATVEISHASFFGDIEFGGSFCRTFGDQGIEQVVGERLPPSTKSTLVLKPEPNKPVGPPVKNPYEVATGSLTLTVFSGLLSGPEILGPCHAS